MSTCSSSPRLMFILAAALLFVPAVAFAQATVVREVVPVAVPPVAEAAVVPQPEVPAAGQIIRTKQVDVRGTTEKVLVALLDTGNGQRQIVDLGPTLNFKAVPVNTGDQISVRGPIATLGQSSVLVATAAHIGSDDVFIKRAAPVAVAAGTVAVPAAVAALPAGYPVTEQILKLEGRIENIRMVRLRGSGAEHTIAEMVNRNGGIVVVDLGPPAALWRADLKAGQWITVRGQQMNINNRSVFLALEINKTGVPFLIDRHLVHEGPTVLAP